MGKSGLEPARLCISNRFLGETAAAGLGAPPGGALLYLFGGGSLVSLLGVDPPGHSFDSLILEAILDGAPSRVS